MNEFLYWLKAMSQTALGAVIMALAMLVIALIAATLVKKLVTKLITTDRVKNALNKHGSADSLISLVGTLVYLLVFLLFVPNIFSALGATSVSNITADLMDKIWGFVPNILVALIVLFVGYTLAKLIRDVTYGLIKKTGIDAKFASLMSNKATNFELSKAIGNTIYILLLIFIAVESLSILNLSVLSRVGAAIIGYLPAVISAILIMAAAFILSMLLDKYTQNKTIKAYTLPIKIVIFTIGVFMSLNQLGIATEMVNTAFILIIASVCVAGAIAFGIGGRAFAAKTLERFDKKLSDKNAEPNTESDSNNT